MNTSTQDQRVPSKELHGCSSLFSGSVNKVHQFIVLNSKRTDWFYLKAPQKTNYLHENIKQKHAIALTPSSCLLITISSSHVFTNVWPSDRYKMNILDQIPLQWLFANEEEAKSAINLFAFLPTTSEVRKTVWCIAKIADVLGPFCYATSLPKILSQQDSVRTSETELSGANLQGGIRTTATRTTANRTTATRTTAT